MKAILVIDMPNNCSVCPFVKHEDEGWLYCGIHNSDTAFAFKKPDWCPLREVPQKVETFNCEELSDVDDWYDSGYHNGYNACIDEILGDKE